MPVHMGIVCDSCRKVHFIATSRDIKPSTLVAEMYLLQCTPPCPQVQEFRKENMRPFYVAEDAFQSGYAMQGEYVLVQAVTRTSGKNSIRVLAATKS